MEGQETPVSNEEEIAEDSAVQTWHDLILGEMKLGTQKDAIVAKVTEAGVEKRNAEELVNEIFPAILSQAENEMPTVNSALLALVGGLVTAAVGAALWCALAIYGNMEVGYLAWGIGVAVGFAVVLCTGGKKGVLLQMISVGCSIAALVAGKTFTMVWALRMAVGGELAAVQKAGKDMGPEMTAALEQMANIPYLSMQAFEVFFTNYQPSGFDLLWIFLALTSAWAIPKALGVDLEQYPSSHTM